MTTANPGASGSSAGRRLRRATPGSGARIVSRPARSSAGKHRARLALESDTPNRNPSTSLVGFRRNQMTVRSSWSAVLRSKLSPPPSARCRLARERLFVRDFDRGDHIRRQRIDRGDRQPVRWPNTTGDFRRFSRRAIIDVIQQGQIRPDILRTNCYRE